MGKYINGIRVNTDDPSGKIKRFDILLGGYEVSYPEIEGFVDFGKSELDWTYEWPPKEDLVHLNFLTL